MKLEDRILRLERVVGALVLTLARDTDRLLDLLRESDVNRIPAAMPEGGDESDQTAIRTEAEAGAAGGVACSRDTVASRG